MTNFLLFRILALLFTLALLSSCSSKPPVVMSEPQLFYSYAKLQLYDLDQMNEIINDKLEQYKKTGKENFLIDAARICFSRPNSDGVVEKIIDGVRFRAQSNENWESAIDKLTTRTIASLRTETTAAVDQVTYLILMENLVSELKPEFVRQYQSPKFETKLIERIAASNIAVSSAAQNESRLNFMGKIKSPSALAQVLIDEKNKKLQIKKSP